MKAAPVGQSKAKTNRNTTHRHTTNMRIYDLGHYDQYFRLRMPAMMWLMAIWTGMPAVMLSADVRKVMGHWSTIWNDPWLLPGAVVVFFVFWVYGQRIPKAKWFWRQAWRFGRQTLMVGLLLGGAALIARHRDVLILPTSQLFLPIVTMLVIQLSFVGYCLRSRYLRDFFADFPEPTDLERPKTSRLAKSKPVSPGEAHYQAALLHLKANQPDEALIALRDAVTKDPDHVLAWLASGRVMEWMGHKEEAFEAYKVAKGVSDALLERENNLVGKA
jgi:hypothetical protein